jgi:hypothetical protein
LAVLPLSLREFRELRERRKTSRSFETPRSFGAVVEGGLDKPSKA